MGSCWKAYCKSPSVKFLDEMPDIPIIQKTLVIISKILQAMANRGPFEPNSTHSQRIDTFVTSSRLLDFMHALLVRMNNEDQTLTRRMRKKFQEFGI
jgi:hypothetical protein